MGRESRQTRRQRQRREQAKHQQTGMSRWAVLGGIAVLAAVVALLAFLALGGNSISAGTSSATPTPAPGPTIDGIECNSMEQATYHIHGHLEFYDKGKRTEVPPFVGEDINNDCLYWTHTHEPSYGVLHVEAPKKITPTLGDFFDVWHQPLSRQKAWKYSVAAGKSMKVFVNEKPYSGDVRAIKIKPHTDITIEVGPPFVTPKPFDYKAQNL